MAEKTDKRAVLIAAVSVVGFLFSVGGAHGVPSSKPLPSSERKFHIINLSLPKTGTGSISGIFSNHRSADEFMYRESVDRILDWREGRIDGAALDAFLLARDGAKKYELDSASFLGMAVERVVPLFPKAKFLLSVRDGEEWIVSFLGMMVEVYGPDPRGAQVSESWATRYGKAMASGFDLKAFADPARLGERVHPWLPELAAFWGRTTLETLERLKRVPKDRRLILRTKDLSRSLGRLAAFAGVPVSSLVAEKSHQNKGRKLPEVRESLGREAIAAAVKPWQEKVDAALAEYDSPVTARPAGNNDKPTSPSRLKK